MGPLFVAPTVLATVRVGGDSAISSALRRAIMVLVYFFQLLELLSRELLKSIQLVLVSPIDVLLVTTPVFYRKKGFIQIQGWLRR